MAKKKTPTNKPPRARRTAADQLKLAKEKVAKLEADAKVAKEKAAERKAAGPSARILNAIGRDYRLLTRARERLQIAGAIVDTVGARSAAVLHITDVLKHLAVKWEQGMATKRAYVEETGDAKELDRVQPLDGSATDE